VYYFINYKVYSISAYSSDSDEQTEVINIHPFLWQKEENKKMKNMLEGVREDARRKMEKSSYMWPKYNSLMNGNFARIIRVINWKEITKEEYELYKEEVNP
jgi:hypothetical protein